MERLEPFNGQWTGTLNSKNYYIINFDIRGGDIRGRITVIDINKYTFGDYIDLGLVYWLDFNGREKDGLITGSATGATLHLTSGEELSQEAYDELLEVYPSFEVANTTRFIIRIAEGNLKVEYDSFFDNLETVFVDGILTKAGDGLVSTVEHEQLSWDEFKTYALGQSDGAIYRGQPKNWGLKTSFHRTGRSDVISYLDVEVPDLERHLNANSRHVYDIEVDKSLGALLNLAQHHGYPTPLLDWTYSPFVAAFFAFENELMEGISSHVSIFNFDERAWSAFRTKQARMRTPMLELSVLELPINDNPRVMPQQSVIMYSNTSDIEGYITSMESHFETSYIKAVSIPVTERKKALRDLSLMGINKGSLFPGLDGVCQQLKVRHFES